MSVKIDWYRKRTNPSTPVPAEVAETDASLSARDGRYRTWMESVVEQHERDGGFDNLKGKGKPLQLQDGVGFEGFLNGVLKEAKFLPRWLELQHEVYKELQIALKKIDADKGHEIHWDKIHQKIKEYNSKCPNSLLQKPLVTADNIHQQLPRWESQDM